MVRELIMHLVYYKIILDKFSALWIIICEPTNQSFRTCKYSRFYGFIVLFFQIRIIFTFILLLLEIIGIHILLVLLSHNHYTAVYSISPLKSSTSSASLFWLSELSFSRELTWLIWYRINSFLYFTEFVFNGRLYFMFSLFGILNLYLKLYPCCHFQFHWLHYFILLLIIY